jgi:hypothetical protein
MNPAPTTHPRVLALDPFSRGFGFVVLEGLANLVDWGMKEARSNKGARSLAQVASLIEHYQPGVLVAEDHKDSSCRRCARVRDCIQAMIALAAKREVRTCQVSRHTVRKVFSDAGAQTKEEIAAVIAHRFSELAPMRPPVRKSWMSEAERMSVFDATALALTFFLRHANMKTVRLNLRHFPADKESPGVFRA